MKNTFLKMVASGLAVAMLAVFAHFTVSAQKTEDQGVMHDRRTLEGSWNSLVTIRACATGTPLFTFPAIQTYMRGGTMQDSAADSRRTSGHGVWRHHGGRTYSAAFQFVNFDPAGNPTGKTKVSLENTVDRSGNRFDTVAEVEVFDTNGNRVATACATGISTRFD